MADFPLLGAQRYATYGPDATTSRGTSITAGATNVKGSYTQLTAATDFAADGFYLWTERGTDSWDDFLMDFATGGAGSEQIVVPNLLYTQPSDPHGSLSYWPIPLDSGVRLSARCQSSANAQPMRTMVTIVAQGFGPSQPLSRVTAYGATTADSGGISIDPGGVANTKGSYTQITASTTNNITALNIAFGNQFNVDRLGGERFLIDLAVGGAASEYAFITNLPMQITATEVMTPMYIGPIFVNIPSGTRLSARAQSDNIDAADRLFDIVIYGMD